MRNLKRALRLAAHSCRLISRVIEYWYVLLALLCLISPISPHLRLPYALSYSDCAYVGTRGVMRPATSDCPFVTIIDTRDEEIIRW